jgi:hypothetical protein
LNFEKYLAATISKEMEEFQNKKERNRDLNTGPTKTQILYMARPFQLNSTQIMFNIVILPLKT